MAETSRSASDTINMVIRVTLWGGIIGLVAGNAHLKLRKAIRHHNQQGWQVVQVLEDPSGNIFVLVVRMLLLVLTIFLFTTNNGFMVVFERASSDAKLSGDSLEQDQSSRIPSNLDVKGSLGI